MDTMPLPPAGESVPPPPSLPVAAQTAPVKPPGDTAFYMQASVSAPTYHAAQAAATAAAKAAAAALAVQKAAGTVAAKNAAGGSRKKKWKFPSLPQNRHLFTKYQIEEVLLLVEVVKDYVDTSGNARLDWSLISTSLPWPPQECQALWRRIAYKWTTNDQVDISEHIEGNDSDVEDSLVFKKEMSKRRWKRQLSRIEDPGANSSQGRKTRIPWTKEEDTLLIDGVKQLGEGNWTAIRNYTSLNRVPPQLSQHWTALKKRAKKGKDPRSAEVLAAIAASEALQRPTL